MKNRDIRRYMHSCARELPQDHTTANQLTEVAGHRAESLRREMAKRNIGACVLFDAVNIRYASGTRNM